MSRDFHVSIDILARQMNVLDQDLVVEDTSEGTLRR